MRTTKQVDADIAQVKTLLFELERELEQAKLEDELDGRRGPVSTLLGWPLAEGGREDVYQLVIRVPAGRAPKVVGGGATEYYFRIRKSDIDSDGCGAENLRDWFRTIRSLD